MNLYFKAFIAAISALCTVCLILFAFIFMEELNIKMIERENMELVKQQEIEKLKYYQTLNGEFDF